jgi:hypothetical protein
MLLLRYEKIFGLTRTGEIFSKSQQYCLGEQREIIILTINCTVFCHSRIHGNETASGNILRSKMNEQEKAFVAFSCYIRS